MTLRKPPMPRRLFEFSFRTAAHLPLAVSR